MPYWGSPPAENRARRMRASLVRTYCRGVSIEPYEIIDLIRIKCDGGALSEQQIDWLISTFTRGGIADEQMSALAMAVFFRGLTREELSCWTQAMIDSGLRLDFSGLSRPAVAKLSTGRGGRNTTLALVPPARARGVA